MATIHTLLRNANAVNFTAKFTDVTKVTKVKDETEESETDAAKANTPSMTDLPAELILDIVELMDSAADVGKMRLINKRFCTIVHEVFLKALVDDRVVYPRYECFSDFLSLLGDSYSMGVHVRTVTLVSEGLGAPEYGYSWAWEDLENREGELEYTEEDVDIINKANRAHAMALGDTDAFLNRGLYRTNLALLLSRCPNLQTIKVRPLKAGEHVPGWEGPELLKEVSFYKKDLNTNGIYYGDWKYDTVHRRVTVWVDEYGEEMVEDNAGPQASFRDDLVSAIQSSGTLAETVDVE
ncbi:hypothetical protein T440DRAFT_499565 [Plenodomus tracheiphilus IPT5]|uniref:F-box domain-containing protein n=1 Tax=Plenodomus tracheiphilus IPT5 TaxID=1408161 RepID=A0A6A7B2P5_9PLEO|nr:hypothetical protein T440DRAFT_499565 [Plenodomus tracheiphilus IPT5]